MKKKTNLPKPGSNPDPKTPPPPPPGHSNGRAERPRGVPLSKGSPELDFPRKLEGCDVHVYHGSKLMWIKSTDDYDMWLLAPNIIKVDNGKMVYVEYNVSIIITYHKYPMEQ